MRIYLLGFMGSGKTRQGKELARLMKYPFVDMDEQIVRKEGVSINKIFEDKGEEFFRSLEKETLRDSLVYKDVIISTGGGTPCFYDNMDWINTNGLSIYLDVHKKVLLPRLWNGRHKRPLIRKLSKTDLSTFIETKLSERRGFYEKASIQYEVLEEDQGSAEELYRFINFF